MNYHTWVIRPKCWMVDTHAGMVWWAAGRPAPGGQQLPPSPSPRWPYASPYQYCEPPNNKQQEFMLVTHFPMDVKLWDNKKISYRWMFPVVHWLPSLLQSHSLLVMPDSTDNRAPLSRVVLCVSKWFKCFSLSMLLGHSAGILFPWIP